jgi:hypothetical protein
MLNFAGVKKQGKTVVFESDKIKDGLLTKDATGKRTEQADKEIAKHTLIVEFDFDKVTELEILDMAVSTTSFMKQFQNNVTKHWTEKIIVETVAKGAYKQSIRDLLDNRQPKSLSDDEKRQRAIKKDLEAGKTKEQIREDFLRTLEGF